MRWVHGSGDRGIGRHQAHGRRENVHRTVRVHGTHRADPTRPDINPILADVIGRVGSLDLSLVGEEKDVGAHPLSVFRGGGHHHFH